jgi:hypothetical protein
VTGPGQVIARQLTRSGETLLLAMEPLDEVEFFAENANGFSAAWVTGHLACVADLFSSWFDGGGLMLDEWFHRVFNETAVTEAGLGSKAAGVDRERYPKVLLLLWFQQAVIKALLILKKLDPAAWDASPPPGVPATLLTGGAVWEILGAHVYWHCGELAGSMPRFFGTYTLNILPHHLYTPELAGVTGDR